MRKIAIPTTEGKLSKHFGQCEEFQIFNIKNNTISFTEECIPPKHSNSTYPNYLIEKGVTHVIANGIGQCALDIFNKNKIQTFCGVDIENPKVLVQKVLDATIETNLNLCDH